MINKFKPLLAVDATDVLTKLEYPKYASMKLDGIRAIFHPEFGLVSRSLKDIQNKQLGEKFWHIIQKSGNTQIIFDGEFYHHDLTFQEITALVMTQDFHDPKTIKKLEKDNSSLLKYYDNGIFDNPLEFHCFEMLNLPVKDDTFIERNRFLQTSEFTNKINKVKQTVVDSVEEINELFSKALEQGYEGLILRDPKSPYKFGRSTLNEENCLKVKPFETFDARVIGVEQSTVVNPDAEKTTNELGRSVTSKKKDDRILIEKASAFWVEYDEHKLKVSLAMPDVEKEEVWKNKESYIGRMIEYKGMQIGAKDVPRHPTFIRYREDK